MGGISCLSQALRLGNPCSGSLEQTAAPVQWALFSEGTLAQGEVLCRQHSFRGTLSGEAYSAGADFVGP